MKDKFPGFPKEPRIVVNGIEYKGFPEDIIRRLIKEIEDLKTKGQSYYCVIPWKLLTDKTICPTAKLLYGEISALANREGYCWASNDHFTKIFNIKSPRRISALIRELKEANYIYVEIDKKAGNKRKIWLHPPILKNRNRYSHKEDKGILINETEDNNILDNNKENIKYKKYSSLKDITEKDLKEIAEKYHVPLGFVKLKLETLKNYCESKGKRYKNYKSALRNFVLTDMQRQIERRQDDRKSGIDARNI